MMTLVQRVSDLEVPSELLVTDRCIEYMFLFSVEHLLIFIRKNSHIAF